ncbi:MAG: S9 family peptidase [Tissierellales bacterium]|nr:S9 family peptidase [Tissierellales bacterium]MBN2826584.1 S9 family peptidase [Tissierellales bacterium]
MKEMIKADDFLNIQVLSGLKVNEENDILLYFVNESNLEHNRYHKLVCAMKLSTNQTHYLSLPFEPDDFSFYQQGIVFSVIKGDATELYLFELSSESLTLLACVPFKIGSFEIMDEHIYFTAIIQDDNCNSSVKCSSFAPFFEEGKGVTGNKVNSLMRSDLKGRSIHLITSLDMDVAQIVFDRTHLRIAFTAFDKKIFKPVASQLYLYRLATEELTRCQLQNYRIDYLSSVSEEYIVFAGVNLSVQSRNDHQQLYKVSARSLEFEALGQPIDFSNEHPNIITDCAFSTSSPMFAFDGCVYSIRNVGSRQLIYQTQMNGQTTVIETSLTAIHAYCITHQGIYLVGLKNLELHELYCLQGQRLICLTSHNAWLKEKMLSTPEKIKLFSNNTSIEGWVFPPVQAIQDRKYPGILMIHGGPKMAYSDVYNHDAQLLCSLGYFVFYANPSGSGIAGDDFSNIRGHFADLPFQELMDFTDTVLKDFPQIDKELLGVIGGSYGGYMTNYIVAHTNRFSAAVSERGISNLMTSFTSTDIGTDFAIEYMNGETPWTSLETYIKDSPIFQANQINTPILFIHGKDDRRCHYTESLNLFSALRFMGQEARFCLFEGENHGLIVKGRPQSKKKRLDEITRWFDKYLRRGAIS